MGDMTMKNNETEILIITTHYPYGSIEENWIELELDEFPQHFSKIHLFPVKELEGLRALPVGVELWEPLATRNRLLFFARQAFFLRTWGYLIDALRECFELSKITLPRAIVCFKFSCYRVAFERNARLKSFLSSQKLKVVYAYWGHIPALAIPISRRRGAGTCVRFHAGDLYTHRPEVGGFFPWRQELSETAELKAFISDHGMDFYSRQTVKENLDRRGVFRLGTRDYGPTRQRQAVIATSPITIVSASWISPIKRVELIAKLSGELARQRETIWHHFGSGKSEIVDIAIADARALGVKVILHGRVPVTQLQQFYREADVTFFVNLSRDEGIPVSIMEAMNAGIPVVATAVGGTSEVVLDGLSGMLVAPDIAEGLSELAASIIAALKPGGLLATSNTRQVWEDLCNGQRKANALARELLALAK